MTPEPIPPAQIVIQHPASITAGEVLGIINQVVQTSLPIIIQSYPPAAGAMMTISTIIGLEKLAVPAVVQIGQLLRGLHHKNENPAQVPVIITNQSLMDVAAALPVVVVPPAV